MLIATLMTGPGIDIACKLVKRHNSDFPSNLSLFFLIQKFIASISSQNKVEELDALAQLLQQRSREAEEAREAQAAEAREHLRQTLERESDQWQRESDRRLQADLSSLKTESDRQCEALRAKLERQREKTKLHERALRQTREVSYLGIRDQHYVLLSFKKNFLK